MQTDESRNALSRARFFLEKAKACPVDARVDFEAFLDAAIVFARAAVHWMKKKHECHPKFKYWWDSILRDPAVEFFRSKRDWILKVAPLEVGQKIFATSVNSTEPSYSPVCASELYYFGDPDEPATNTIEEHLNDLEKLLSKGERLFISAGLT